MIKERIEAARSLLDRADRRFKTVSAGEYGEISQSRLLETARPRLSCITCRS